MTTSSIFKTFYKYPLRTIVYLSILCVAFTTINLLVNVIFTFIQLQGHFTKMLDTGIINEADYSALAGPLTITISPFIPLIALIVVLSIITLPFVYYLFCVGRGYELGVLRALGLSKLGAWLHLVAENVTLVCMSLIVTFSVSAGIYSRFAHSMLSLNSIEDSLYAITGETGEIAQNISINLYALVFILVFALVIIVISLLVQNIIIAKSEPLELIRAYK